MFGVVRIAENEVGIVIKKRGALGSTHLPPGQIIALNGESGIQVDTLATGRHTGYYQALYTIRKVPQVTVPKEEIALVIANDGAPIARDRQLGQVVECNNFQDARAFLTNGGHRGQQLDILTAGTYHIHTELFTIITSENAEEHGLSKEDLQVTRIEDGHIGIVTTQDGASLPAGQIAGKIVAGHQNFQDSQRFIDAGGYRGRQEEYLSAGKYNLNPWFVEVEQIPFTYIPPGAVGVVISHVGELPGSSTENNLVEVGYRGIWKDPLQSGQHALNIRVMDVQVVPTHEIILEWSNEDKPETNYDAQLRAIELRSKDGFPFSVKVTQVISIKGEDAPTMIAKVGSPTTEKLNLTSMTSKQDVRYIKYSSIKDLVTRVLEPLISSHFRNVAQDYKALEFHDNRRQRQAEAELFIKAALKKYGVQAKGTFINDIGLPPALEHVRQKRELASEQRTTYEEEIYTEVARQEIELVKAEYRRRIKESDLQEKITEVQQIVNILGQEGYLRREWVNQLGEIQLPETTFGFQGWLDTLMSQMMSGVPGHRGLGARDDADQLMNRFLDLMKEQPTEFQIRTVPTGQHLQPGAREVPPLPSGQTDPPSTQQKEFQDVTIRDDNGRSFTLQTKGASKGLLVQVLDKDQEYISHPIRIRLLNEGQQIGYANLAFEVEKNFNDETGKFDVIVSMRLKVKDILVQSKYRKHGLGAQILAHAEKLAEASGAREICGLLERPEARRFFEKRNYQFRESTNGEEYHKIC